MDIFPQQSSCFFIFHIIQADMGLTQFEAVGSNEIMHKYFQQRLNINWGSHETQNNKNLGGSGKKSTFISNKIKPVLFIRGIEPSGYSQWHLKSFGVLQLHIAAIKEVVWLSIKKRKIF